MQLRRSVLVLDADQRSALAATRSLGRRGLRVVVADERPATLAGASRHAAVRAVYPSPYDAPERFLDEVERLCVLHRVDVLLPMTDVTTGLVLRDAARFAHLKLPFPSFDAYEAVTDKYRLFSRAEELGLPMPRTWFIDPARADPTAVAARLPFPVVMKPARSRDHIDGRWQASSVRYARDTDELLGHWARHHCFRSRRFLLQERVEGEGQGLFVLYDRGVARAHFAHRRLREKPPSGGVSVLCESIPVREELCRVADALLGPLAWHGVAMVEFKVAADGTPYLMEINGRFWGSLQLAVDAGIDFPWLACALAFDELPKEAPGFAVGRRSRWLLGDLDNLYLQLKAAARGGGGHPLAAIGAFLAPAPLRTRHEVNRIDDPLPFFLELRRYLRGGA